MEQNNSKELFRFIRNSDTKGTPSLKTILSEYNIKKHSISDILEKLDTCKENILLIDARSEREFEESSVPFSSNFPVLTNSERHDTGLIYKKYSPTSALWLAMRYADPKSETLRNFLEENNASEKEIVIYCWRGGGRSGYLSKMISDLGYSASVITGGYKSYRKTVVNFFSQKVFPYQLLELSGLTGCGKTELLNSLKPFLPVIDLEDAAKHYSSLLGHIPYEITNTIPVKNQSSFENNIFSSIYFDSNNSTNSTNSTFLIESESKRVGKFEIPVNLYGALLKAPSIRIISSIDHRVKRIVKDYFGSDLRGIEPMINILTARKSFFRQQLSGDIFDELILLLENERVDEFTEIMIKEYYDKKYRVKEKEIIAEVSSDDSTKAVSEIKSVYENVRKLLNPAESSASKSRRL